MAPLPLIVAHRGFSAQHRENSPGAWRAAVAAGADGVEADLRVTRDGAVVCCHDADLQRLAKCAVAVAEMEAGELAALEAEGFPVAPPLAMLLAVLPASCPLLLDIKDERPAALGAILEALMLPGGSGGGPGHAPQGGRDVMLGLHAATTVRRVREAGWRGRILGLLGGRDEEEHFFAAGGDVLRIWEWDATPERLQHEANRGRPAWITTGEGDTGRKVGDYEAAALRRMAKNGAAAFLINDPVGARAALSEAVHPMA